MFKDKQAKIGDILLGEKIITEQQLLQAIDVQKKTHEKLDKILVSMGLATDKDISEAIRKHTGINLINLDDFEITAEVTKAVPKNLVLMHRVFPIKQENNKLTLAMADPMDFLAINDVKSATGFDVEAVIATQESIIKAIEQQFGVTALEEWEEQERKMMETPVISLKDYIAKLKRD